MLYFGRGEWGYNIEYNLWGLLADKIWKDLSRMTEISIGSIVKLSKIKMLIWKY